MTPEAVSIELGMRPRQRHATLAAVAIVLSLVLHIVVWREFPTFPIAAGRPVQQHDYHPIQLRDVLTAPPPRRDEKPMQDRIRPENPKQLADLLGAPAPMPELATDAIRIPAPPDIKSPVNSLTPAMSGPVSSPDRSRWEPRQEILQVEQRIVEDRLAMLPRQLVPLTPRIDHAPDVILPIDIPMTSSGRQSAPMGLSNGAAGYTLTSPGGVEGGPGAGVTNREAGSGTASSAKLFPGPTDIFNEKLRDISKSTAVDKYLDLGMYVYRPPDENGAAYFELQIRRHGEETLPVLPKDVLFIQDCSESMTPWKLAECKEGLRRWLEKLAPPDRFQIISFRETVSRCFDGWVPVNAETRRQGLAYIEGMRSVGNTDVYASLDAARRMRDNDSRPVVAVLVSDARPTAGVVGSSDIIEGFTRANQGAVPVFSVGGGKKVNRFLIDLLSYRNRGESLVVPEATDIPGVLDRLAGELSRPVLYDLNYRISGFSSSEIFPQSLTHLFLDRPLVIYGRIAPGEDKAAVQILGRASGQQLDMLFPLDLSKALPGQEVIRQRWAWQKVYALIGHYIQTQQPALLQQIHAHAHQYNLIVPYGYGDGMPAN